MRILIAVYDNESAANIMPLGACYVAAYCVHHGYDDITWYNQDVYHWPDEHLTTYLDKNKFDIVALGFVAGYYQHRKIQSMCKAINQSKNRPFVVLAGHGPTPVPEFYIKLTEADAVVMGEGELPFLNLVKALDLKLPMSSIKGIAYKDGDKCFVNEREKVIKDLDSIPEPYLKGLPMEYYINAQYPNHGMHDTDRMMGMLSSRGCPYHCNFCQRLEAGYRIRSPEAVVEEIKRYKIDYGMTFIIFWCELLMVSEKRTASLMEALIKADLGVRFWCTGRVNVADSKSLALMKRAGCAVIDYGIEQFDNKSLIAMNKRQSEKHVIDAIERTQDAGIELAFNIIWGNKGDTLKSIRKSVDLLHKYNTYLQLRAIRPVTPYPGTPLYDECIKTGTLKGPQDFYDKHANVELLTVNLTDIPDDVFHDTLFGINQEIIKDY